MAGSVAGTERWIVCLRNRGFSLRQELQNIRLATAANRPALIAALRTRAQADQAGIAQAVVAAGGSVQRHYWHLSALAVEIPPAAVASLRQVPRVVSLWPVRGRPSSDVGAEVAATRGAGLALHAPVAPQASTVDGVNHNVGAAWGILGTPQNPYRGAGARVAVFDSGIDVDTHDTNGVANLHPAFLVSGSTTQSRVVANLKAGAAGHADCNILTATSPYVLLTPGSTTGYRPVIQSGAGHDPACGHGTAMAAIVAGAQYAGFAATGHAPDAEIVDVACSSFPNPQGSGSARDPWEYTDEGYLNGVEALREYLLDEAVERVHVVNLSLHGEPSPFHPISLALDSLARGEDVLLVTGAGNFGDSTTNSNGFYHGVAVGAVHARSLAAPQNLSFVPLPESSRGPLVENEPGRFYPDLCASGGGIGHLDAGGVPEFDYPGSSFFSYPNGPPIDGCMMMVGIDIIDPSSASTPANRVSPLRPNLGTSEACAQVAGAATLYRGRVPAATAEETRAALLLNVMGTYGNSNGTTSESAEQHTYTGRNTFGVGYLRDDLLAEFAVRAAAIEPLAAVVALTQAAPSTDQTAYSGLTPGVRYAAVACWRRHLIPGDEFEGDLANVDLEIVDASNQAVLARSCSPANSYERVVFHAPASGSVKLRVSTAQVALLLPPLEVQLVARRLPADLDPNTSVVDRVHAASGDVTALSAGAACTATDREWRVTRIVPYPLAYGSAAFSLIPQASGVRRHVGYDNGFDLGRSRSASSTNLGSYQYLLHVQYSPVVVGGPMTIAGLAFRTWRPMVANDLSIEITMEEGPWWVPLAGISPPSIYPLPGAGAVAVVNGFRLVEAPESAAATGLAAATTGLDSFPVVVPFDTQFPYTGTIANGKALHLWIKVQGSTALELVVDGTNDGDGQPVESHVAVYNGAISPPLRSIILGGRAPVLGLIPQTSAVARELRLVAFGEPASGSGVVSNLEVRVYSGLAPGTPALLVWGGLSASPTSLPPCNSWLSSSNLAAVGATDAFGMESFVFALQPNLVHLELALQAVLFPTSGGQLLTNALRVRVGGGL